MFLKHNRNRSNSWLWYAPVELEGASTFTMRSSGTLKTNPNIKIKPDLSSDNCVFDTVGGYRL